MVKNRNSKVNSTFKAVTAGFHGTNIFLIVRG